MTREALLHAAGVPENAMAEFLDGLEDRHGGAIEYLRSIGVDDDMQTAVRRRFLD